MHLFLESVTAAVGTCRGPTDLQLDRQAYWAPSNRGCLISIPVLLLGTPRPREGPVAHTAGPQPRPLGSRCRPLFVPLRPLLVYRVSSPP